MSASLPLLAGLLGAWLTLPASSQERATSVEAQVDEALADVAGPADVSRAASQLVRLGEPALQPLFERLCAGEIDVPHRAVLLGTFALLPRADVLAFIAQLARRPLDGRQREVGLDLLARLGAQAELRLVLELGTPEEADAPPDPALRAALETALLGIAARERGAARLLADFFPRVAPASQASIAAVLTRIGGEESANLLARLLGSAGTDSDALLLLELIKVAQTLGGVQDLLALERVRGYLGHPDSRLVVLATLAADRLEDHGAVPDLIVLLEDARANIRRGAHAALKSLTALNLAADPELWLAWLDEGLAWWDERAESCRVALVSGTAVEAAAALQEVAKQRLFLHELVPLLQLAARRSERDLVAYALRALRALPERAARSALLSLCAHPDASVSVPARAALRQSGRARPSTPPAGQAHLPLLSRTP